LVAFSFYSVLASGFNIVSTSTCANITADSMMSKPEPVDYGAMVADDFLKWSAGWSWTWKVRVPALLWIDRSDQVE
jgi:hypothetical protein